MAAWQRWVAVWTAALLSLGTAAVHAQTEPPAPNAAQVSPAQKTPATQALDVSYITGDAMVAVVLHPHRLLTAPELEVLPVEVISAAGKKELGIDPVDVDQILAFAEAPVGPTPPQFGVVVHLRTPHRSEDVLPALDEMTAPAEIDGKPYRKATGPMSASVYMPDDRTLIVASEPVLQEIVAGKGAAAPGGLARLVQAVYRGQDALAVVSLDPVRDMLNQQLAGAPLPPALQELKEVPDLTSAVASWLRMTGGQSEIFLGIKARDPQSAERLEQILNNLIDTGSQMMLAQTGEMAASEDPVEQAVAQYAERMNRRMVDFLRPKRQGDTLTLVRSEGQAVFNSAGAGVAIALLLPAVQAAREAARRVESMNNLKQIGLAMHNNLDVHGHFPPAASADKAGQPLLSWRVHLLPFLEEQALYDQFHLDEPWDSPHNRPLVDKMPQIYARPGSTAAPGQTTYLAVTGEGTVLGKKGGSKLFEITDGVSNTILVVEADDNQAVPWTKPEDLAVAADDPLRGLGNARPGGFNALFADGSVRLIAATIDPDVLHAMFTAAGGEMVEQP